MKHNCSLATDCVIFSEEKIVLIKRKNNPFKGQYALPGGFVEPNETVENACIREIKEETNLNLKSLALIGVYAKPGRDPRGRVISFAFLAEADLSTLKAGDDAKEAKAIKNWKNIAIAFDHKQIIKDAIALKKVLNKLTTQKQFV